MYVFGLLEDDSMSQQSHEDLLVKGMNILGIEPVVNVHELALHSF